MTAKVPLRYEVHGGVATITIDRPEKSNAMTYEMDRRLNELVVEINVDEAVRAVILTGAGGRAFCAGSDLGGLDSYGTNWQFRNRTDRNLDYALGIWKIRKPVIAAIDGYCIGGGLEMACAADIRVATVASTFAAGEINWGWHGGSGATQFLTRVVGPGFANEILMTGDRFGRDAVERMGLINSFHETRGGMLAAAQALADRIAGHAPIPVEAVKKLVRVAQSSSVEIGLAYENDLFTLEMRTRDAAEGQAAFAAKRPPVFTGD
jgi:enoyl-CoA hydratase